MAAYAKVVMFFGGMKWGWTEVVYWNSSTGNLSNARADAKTLVLARRGVLASPYALEAVRVEECGPDGNTFLAGRSRIGYVEDGAGRGAFVATCSSPWMAALVGVYSDTGAYRRNYYIRGLPDDALCVGPDYAVPYPWPESFKTKIKTLTDALTRTYPQDSAFAMRVKAKDAGRRAAVMVSAVTVADEKFSITTNTPITLRFAGGPALPAVPGDIVHVHGADGAGLLGLNGDHRVLTVTPPSTYLLSAKQRRECEVDYKLDAVAWGVTTQLIEFDNTTLSRPVKRSCGGPFFGTRGKAPKGR